MNTLKRELPLIQTTALMYNSNLIWSGLCQEDMFLLYSLEQVGYLTNRAGSHCGAVLM
jgi:hypothetical protein